MTRRGIWPRLLADGCVIDAAWRDAIDTGRFVGTCTVPAVGGKECGQPLRPGPPFPQGRYRTGYTATCSGCGVRWWICRLCFAKVRRNASHVADPLPMPPADEGADRV